MADPFSHCDHLREQGPLVRIRLPILGKVWVTTTQSALGAVLKDTQTFSLRKSDGSVTGMQWWMPKSIRLLANNMLTMDEPDHTRLRHLVDEAFRRDFIMGLEPSVQQTADDLAAGLFTEGSEADLIMRFARQLPLSVICELLGIPNHDRERFSNWASSLTTVGSMIGFLRAFGPVGKMTRYVEAEINRQRAAPGDGLIGQLVQMQADGEAISDDEMVAMVFLLLIAGHETTTHVISGGVYELLCNDEQRKWLLEDEAHIALAVEELLRFVSAVQFTKPRNVRRDVVIEGVQLRKGDVVMAMIVAANGDPEAIECPHDFDLNRKPNRHVAFGAGPHFCLGHQLARLEISCALKALFRAYPDLQLAVPEKEIQWNSRVGMRVLSALPVRAV
jgi:cytochrome P450 PksS